MPAALGGGGGNWQRKAAPIATWPIDPTTATGQQPDGQTGWTLAFSDEFNGSALDATKWDSHYPDWPSFNAQNPGGNRTNTGSADYVDDSHVNVTGGNLVLTTSHVTTVAGLPYTSGAVQSLKSFTPHYGFFEARIQISSLPIGIWPAFWMSNSAFNTWPPEIDIMEHFSTEAGYHTNVYTSSLVFGDTVPSDQTLFHTYGCKWDATGVKFYLDGAQVKTTTQTPGGNMYLLLDLAVRVDDSPTWNGTVTMLVDYVRAWS